MPQVVAAPALDRGPRVQRVHLVDAHPVQAIVMRLEHVDQADRLSVGHRHDQVGVGRDVIEHRLGGHRARHPQSVRERPAPAAISS
jgi:hypothetical protein